MDSINAILERARQRLIEAGIPLGRDAEFILEYVLNAKLSTLHGVDISSQQLSQFDELISRRAGREPLDSILGGTEFLGLIIPFNKDTLTPRQETEIMVDSIIRENNDKVGLKILDLCSGSGCIGLALKRHLPDSSVTLADISDSALKIAQQNAKLNGIDVRTIKSDLFSVITDSYDIIVSNPPYIPSQDILGLEKEVVDYDPLLALDGGEDGLDLYKRISERIASHLNDGAVVYIEFGYGQSEDIKNIFKNSLKDIEIIKDYSGIDRYLKARK